MYSVKESLQYPSTVQFNEKTQRVSVFCGRQINMQANTTRKVNTLQADRITQILEEYQIAQIYDNFKALHNFFEQYSNSSLNDDFQGTVYHICERISQQIHDKKTELGDSQVVQNSNQVQKNRIQELLQEIFYLRKKLASLGQQLHSIGSLESSFTSNQDQNIHPNICQPAAQKLLNNNLNINREKASSKKSIMKTQIGQLGQLKKQNDFLMSLLQEAGQLNFIIISQLWKLISILPKGQEIASFLFQQLKFIRKNHAEGLMMPFPGDYINKYQISLNHISLIVCSVNKFFRTQLMI